MTLAPRSTALAAGGGMSMLRAAMLLLLLVTGCARLTPAGKRVAVAETYGAVRPCSPIGEIERQALSKDQALVAIRNEAAKRKADRILVKKEVHLQYWTTVIAAAYRCAGIKIRARRPPPRQRRVAKDKVEIALVPTVFDEAAVALVPARIFEDAVGTAITDAGAFSVLGHDDINTLIDLEKEKDLLGCDEVSCFAEIGGALGVPFLAKLNVARVDGEWVVTSKVIDVSRTEVVRRSTDFVVGDTAALLKAVPGLVRALLTREKVGPRAPEAPVTKPPPSLSSAAEEVPAADRQPVVPVEAPAKVD